MTSWRDVIPAEDRRATLASGFGRSVSLGRRPALLVIDVQYRTAGETPMELAEAVKQYPTSCGRAAWDTIERIRDLLAVARGRRLPVFYAVVERANRLDNLTWGGKIPSVTGAENQVGSRGTEIVKEIAPHPDDIVVSKRYASCFFGTPLVTYLTEMRADTLVITGCTTSGCVRATAVDAFQYGFRTAVVEDGVYDRSAISHAVSLFDLDSKYANVIPAKQAVEYFEGLTPGLTPALL